MQVFGGGYTAVPRSGGVAAAALRTMSASVPTGADDRAYSHYYYSSADETDGPWNGAGKFDSLTLNNPHVARAKPAGRFSSLLRCRFSFIQHTHTRTHPFNGPLSRTTRVSRYQKGITNLDFTEARDSE